MNKSNRSALFQKVLHFYILIFFSLSNFGIVTIVGMMDNVDVGESIAANFTLHSEDSLLFTHAEIHRSTSADGELIFTIHNIKDDWENVCLEITLFNFHTPSAPCIALLPAAYANQTHKTVPLFVLYHSWRSFLS